MIAEKIIPSKIIKYSKCNISNYSFGIVKDPFSPHYFDTSLSVEDTFKKFNSKVEILNVENLNEKKSLSFFKCFKQKYLIFSGKSGEVLTKEFLCKFKKVLHIHGGQLPHYRGRTTFYYSILKENKIGASSIFINPKIDEGPIIISKKINPSSKLNIDYLLDPLFRAEILILTLKKILKNNEIDVENQVKSDGKNYFVIHPVLKNLAIKRYLKL